MLGRTVEIRGEIDEETARKMLADLERHANATGNARKTAQDIGKALSIGDGWDLVWADRHHEECELKNCASIIGLINIVRGKK